MSKKYKRKSDFSLKLYSLTLTVKLGLHAEVARCANLTALPTSLMYRVSETSGNGREEHIERRPMK
jgi:hypothetical protein